MKLKEIALDNDQDALNKVLDYINKIDLNKYIYSKEDLVYKDDCFHIEDVVNINHTIESIKDVIKKYIMKYWNDIMDKKEMHTFDGEMSVSISPEEKGKDSGNWQLSIESDKFGNFYMNIKTNILNIL